MVDSVSPERLEVIVDMIVERGPCCPADLARRLRLSVQTSRSYFRAAVAGGYLVPVGKQSRESVPGRRPVLYDLNPAPVGTWWTARG